MSPDKNRSVDPRARLAIARWPDDAPRGAVTTFGAEQGIWRKDAPASCAGARRGEGPAAAGGPRSRRARCRPEPPARSGSRPGPRCARGSGGARDRGRGPISVHDKMAAMGLEALSSAWLARDLLVGRGWGGAEPSKRPRAAWRRFDPSRPQRLLAARAHNLEHIIFLQPFLRHNILIVSYPSS